MPRTPLPSFEKKMDTYGSLACSSDQSKHSLGMYPMHKRPLIHPVRLCGCRQPWYKCTFLVIPLGQFRCHCHDPMRTRRCSQMYILNHLLSSKQSACHRRPLGLCYWANLWPLVAFYDCRFRTLNRVDWISSRRRTICIRAWTRPRLWYLSIRSCLVRSVWMLHLEVVYETWNRRLGVQDFSLVLTWHRGFDHIDRPIVCHIRLLVL